MVQAAAGETVRVPLDELRPTWRGRRVPGAGNLAQERVTSMGLLLADGDPGAFRLEVRWIRAVG